MGPVQNEIGNFAEELTIIPKVCRLSSAAACCSRASARARSRPSRADRWFGVFLVAALGFSQGRGIALDIQYVVGDLESQPDGVGIGIERASRSASIFGALKAPRATAARIKAPVLRACMSSEPGQRQRLADGAEVDGLSAGHADAAGCLRELGEHSQPLHGVDGERRIAREQLERERLQASPASIAVASSNALWQVGLPRRRSSLSMAGRSSCTSE